MNVNMAIALQAHALRRFRLPKIAHGSTPTKRAKCKKAAEGLLFNWQVIPKKISSEYVEYYSSLFIGIIL